MTPPGPLFRIMMLSCKLPWVIWNGNWCPVLRLLQISTTCCTDSVPWGSRRVVPLMVIHEDPLTTSPLAMTLSSTSSEALGIQRRKALPKTPSNGPIELKQQPPPFSGSSCKHISRYKGCWLQPKELHRVPTAAWDKAENKTGELLPLWTFHSKVGWEILVPC